MATAHTPGPWTYGVRRDGSMWLSLGDPAKGPHYQGDLCAAKADADLIVASPDMLAALRELVDACDDEGLDHDGPYNSAALDRQTSALKAAQLAIAKAEGSP